MSESENSGKNEAAEVPRMGVKKKHLHMFTPGLQYLFIFLVVHLVCLARVQREMLLDRWVRVINPMRISASKTNIGTQSIGAILIKS